MPVVVRDDSIGQALGTLAGGLMGDPKSEWEAYAYKQKIAGVQADNVQKAFELQQLRDQRAAQDAVIGKFDSMFQPENFNVPIDVEGPRPAAPGFQGPMPPVFNPEYGALDSKLEFARAASRNAIMRGGSPDQALSTAYAALGQGDILVNGVPTDPAKAAQSQTMLTGQLPNASVPLTEIGRVKMAEEAAQAKLKENVSVPDKGFVLLSPEQGKSMGVQPDANGQYIIRNQPAADGAGGVSTFGGEGWQQQASNVLIEYSTRAKNGQPIPPELEMAASIAWNDLYGTKTEMRTGPDGSIVRVPVQPSLPQGIVRPGSGATAGSPTGPRGPQASWPQPQVVSGNAATAPPVSATAAATQPAVAQTPAANGVEVVLPGKKELPTEAASRDATFIQQMDAANQNVEAMLNGGYRPNFSGAFLSRITNSANEQDGMAAFAMQLLAAKARGEVDPEGQTFETQAMTFLNAVLRDESGAAVPIGEYPKYIATMIPRYGDDEKTIKWKTFNRQMAILARRKGLDKDSIASIGLGQNPALAQMLAQEAGAGATAAQPQQAPAAGSVDRVKLREEANAALVKIDSLNIPSSEKMKRKAAVEQRMQQMIGGQ